MDRKSIIILALSFILLFLWYPVIVKRLYPPKPLPPGSTNLVSQPITAPTNGAPAPAVTVSQPQPAASLVSQSTVEGDVEEKTIEVTNATTHYTFTSDGGGLKQVELLGYPESVARRGRKGGDTQRVATLNAYAPAPSLEIQAGEALRTGGFELSRTATGVRAEKTLTNGLAIIKEFTPSTNYLMLAAVRFENRSSNAVTVPAQDWIIGTATPMGPDDQGKGVIGAYWYDGDKKKDVGPSYFSSSGFACIPRTPPAEYRAGDSNVVWVAVHNQFFALAAMPEKAAQAVVVQEINLPQVSGQAAGAKRNGKPAMGYIAAMVYPGFTLQPGQTQEHKIHLFAGPKEYQTLARIGNRFHNNLDLVMGFGFFGFFAKALLLTMNWLHDAVRFSYGWAIIVITVIIKTLFWPLTQASTRSMKRLQALQPQMKAIQEKYKDDPTKMNRKTMEFMREHKVSPLGGCLPMLLQIPVFFGFYQMIQSAIELRGAHWLWVNDLSKPDTLFTIPGTEFPFNLLPLLMGATMLWQARLTPPSPGMDPAQAKIMRYMPLMFMVFLYNFSAGLTLYWTVQNLLTIAQTKITKAKEEPAATSAKGPALTPAPKKRK